MKEYVTRFIQIKNSGVRIRLLTLGELLNVLNGLDHHIKWLDETDNIVNFEALRKTRKLKKYAKNVIRYATNVKRPKVKHLFLINLIISFNLGNETPDNLKVKPNQEYKSNVFELVDLIASEYGWTDKYILDNVTFEQAKIYAKIIQERKEKEFAKNVITTAFAMHDPEGDVVKNAVQIVTGKKRKHVSNVKTYINKLKNEKDKQEKANG